MAALEELDSPFVLRGRFPRVKRTQVSAFAGLGIDLSRIESILTGLEFTDHGV